MFRHLLQTIFSHYILYVLAFEDVIVNGQTSQEMTEQGRAQYQLLQERGTLPQFGSCWKNAVIQVNEGCRSLSEESQSDIALHLTNCFLEMSGHETYKCELDKKPNLRGICISSMSDRAFNVYTEFYTHTQNMCWFLRGQIWHETIAENTLKVGKQLEISARNQEDILNNQRESLELQEKLLKYGLVLEKIMEDFYISTQKHQEILSVMSHTLGSLQSWLLGEISWIDTLIFYVAAGMFVIFFTSTRRTAGARLINISLLTLNAAIERAVCYWMSARLLNNDIKAVHADYNYYIWMCRYFNIILCIGIVFAKAYSFKNYVVENNVLLQNIYNEILGMTHQTSKSSICNDSEAFVEKINSSSCEPVKNGFSLAESHDVDENLSGSFRQVMVNGRRQVTPMTFDLRNNNGRYNLRSRHGTPDSGV